MLSDTVLVGVLRRGQQSQAIDRLFPVGFGIKQLEQVGRTLHHGSPVETCFRWFPDRAQHGGSCTVVFNTQHLTHADKVFAVTPLDFINLTHLKIQAGSRAAKAIGLKGVRDHAAVILVHVRKIQRLSVDTADQTFPVDLQVGLAQGRDIVAI